MCVCVCAHGRDKLGGVLEYLLIYYINYNGRDLSTVLVCVFVSYLL